MVQPNLSIGKILLLTYIIIASSYCSNLFSNGMKQAIESNRHVQHLILIVLIMSLMILFGNPFGSQLTSNYAINIAIMTLLIYAWFILTTKLDFAWGIVVIILLAIYFLYESYNINNLNLQMEDSNVNSEMKEKLIDTFNKTSNYILVGIFGITVLGSLFYSSEKQIQYGGGYSINKFWFG